MRRCIPSERALKKAGMSVNDIDLFEVNEAFASVVIAWPKTTSAELQGQRDRRAIALGHARWFRHQADDHADQRAEQRGKRYGLQTMCEGGGMANVTIVERL